jgi:hypothetical protein
MNNQKRRQRSFSLGRARRRSGAGRLGLLAVAAGLAMSAGTAWSQVSFTDVTAAAGTTGGGETWGSAWGDYNGDGWPDLFVNGHRDVPRFYRNNGNGTFTDIAVALDPGTWVSDPFNDKHGATWVDIDNDGDQDLYLNVSATGPGQMLINEGGVFWDLAASANLANDSTARQSMFFDWDNDGYNDVAVAYLGGLIMREQNPTQGSLDFPRVFNTGISYWESGCPGRVNYGQLIDLNDDGTMEFICYVEGLFPNGVFDTSTLPFTNLTSTLPTSPNVNDSVVGDFDGDLRSDIFLVRGAIRPSGASRVNPNRIESWIATSGSTQKGYSFVSQGPITVAVDHADLGLQGAEILNLDPQGVSSGSAGSVSIYYNSGNGRWYVVQSGSNKRSYTVIDTVQTTTEPVMFGLDTPDLPVTARLLKNEVTGPRYDFAAGFQEPISCVSAVAGDFDNDMDLDLYLVCRQGVENLPNRLYENLGNGVFALVPGAAGAEGLVGAGLETGVGVGDAVTLADYDADGFLDLFIVNGLLMRPFGEGGRDQLLRNTSGDNGNANRWVQFDLEGTTSNRDGIGAKVYVTANGITQLREQNGGHHRWAQNHQRLHFGLAANTTFDMTVVWPSGIVDNHSGIAANTVYRVTENAGLTPVTFGPPIDDSLAPGGECGQPVINAGSDYGVWLWKDCTTNRWSMRITPGGSPTAVRFEGTFVSTAPISNAVPFSFEGNDRLDTTNPNELGFVMTALGAGIDGVDFDLSPGASTCLAVDLPVDAPLFVGLLGKEAPLPFDMDTFGTCAGTGTVTVADISVDEEAAEAVVTVSLSSPAVGSVFVDYATADVTATAGSDYVAVSGTAEITNGNSSTTIAIPLIGDTLVEGNETFTLTLSNPQGATLGAAVATVTLIDDDGSSSSACGEPAYDPATDRGVFLWRDCSAAGPDEIWHMRVTGGGGAWANFAGFVVSDVLLTTVGFSLEASDSLDASSAGDGAIDYSLFVGGSGVDGFQLTVPPGATTCFNPSVLPADAQVFVGANRQVLTGPFQLSTLGACDSPPNDGANAACGEPTFDPGADQGVFLWRDCNAAGPDEIWTMRVTGGGGPWSNYSGSIASDSLLTTLGFSLEASDSLDASSAGDDDIDYSLFVGGNGVDGFELTVPTGATTCFNPAVMPTGAQVFVGANQEILAGPFALDTLEPCVP